MSKRGGLGRGLSALIPGAPESGEASGLLEVPAKRFWVDYDEEADVLYLSFRRPQGARDSEIRDDGVIIRKRGKEIVGLTILDASKR